jgi:chorismate mutase/prephenate dehydratase
MVRRACVLLLVVTLLPLSAWAQAPGRGEPQKAPPPPELVRARERIDAIDRQLLSLLFERARIVLQIGEVKRSRGLPVHNPERERQVVAGLTAGPPGPLPPASIERIWQQIFAEMRLLEEALPAPRAH